jgi:hypothetical protein
MKLIQFVGFKNTKAVGMEVSIFQDIIICIVWWKFIGFVYSVIHSGFFCSLFCDPEDGVSLGTLPSRLITTIPVDLYRFS